MKINLKNVQLNKINCFFFKKLLSSKKKVSIFMKIIKINKILNIKKQQFSVTTVTITTTSTTTTMTATAAVGATKSGRSSSGRRGSASEKGRKIALRLNKMID
jgi:hypothetical protein